MGASGGKKYDPREKAKKVTRQQLLNELGKRCSSTGNSKQLCAVQMAEFFTCLKKNSGASERCISEQRALRDCMARDLNAKKLAARQPSSTYQVFKYARAILKR